MATQSDGVGFRSTRGPILMALMLSSGLVAIDATIVATAVPSIVHEIGGFASFPWLFSAYLLAQAVPVPVYAKLSDMAGRKPLFSLESDSSCSDRSFAGWRGACPRSSHSAWCRAWVPVRSCPDNRLAISASQPGRFYLRIGFRATALIRITVTVIGPAALAMTAYTPNLALVAGSCFVAGLGLGLLATPSLIAPQSSVEWHGRGVVTGTNLFARSIGSSLGVAVFGAVANAIYGDSPGGGKNPQAIVFASAAVFRAVLVSAALTVVAVLAMPATALEGTVPRSKEPGLRIQKVRRPNGRDGSP